MTAACAAPNLAAATARAMDARHAGSAGDDGDRIVFAGTPAELVAQRSILTGEHLARYVEG